MDENISGAFSAMRETYGRNTLSEAESFAPTIGWTHSFYNGFEIWWLAGMPIMLVFVLTLLSFSLVSGMSGLGKQFRWSHVLPIPSWLLHWLAAVAGATSCSPKLRGRRASPRLDRENLKVGEVESVASDLTLLEVMKVRILTGGLQIPKHIAVIMDGNRRYGKSKYGAGVRGHSDGSKTLVAFTDWCIDAGVKVLTVFAFSTGKWPVSIDFRC